MKGIVERVELPGDPGRIRGEDGKLYTYRQSQVRTDELVRTGQRVDFISLGDEARDIYAVDTPAAPAPAPPALSEPASYTQAPGAYRAKPLANPPEGLWTYFIDNLTKKYARFTGRARRTEYWAYTLFWWIITVAILFLDGIMMALTSASWSEGDVWWFFYFSILWQLGTLMPNIALVVRRLHDLNMSGWFYVIKAADFMFPYIGTIVLFIFMLMDSKPEPNVHGPSPKYDQGQDVASVFS